MKGKGVNIVLRNCHYDITDNAAKLHAFLYKVAKLIGMRKLGHGDVQDGMDSMPGTSVTQMIETSHMAIHGFKVNCVYIFTVVSCKDFNENKLLEFVKTYLKPSEYSVSIFDVDTVVQVTR